MALAEREAEQHRVTGDLEGPLADPGKESELREGRSYQETLRNMEALRRDALGPPGPTMDDIRVAVRAQRIVNEVRAEHVANVHSQDVSQTPSADEVRDARSAETPEAVAPTTNEPAAPAPAAPQVRANELAEAFRPPSPSDPDGTSSISFFA